VFRSPASSSHSEPALTSLQRYSFNSAPNPHLTTSSPVGTSTPSSTDPTTPPSRYARPSYGTDPSSIPLKGSHPLSAGFQRPTLITIRTIQSSGLDVVLEHDARMAFGRLHTSHLRDWSTAEWCRVGLPRHDDRSLRVGTAQWTFCDIADPLISA